MYRIVRSNSPISRNDTQFPGNAFLYREISLLAIPRPYRAACPVPLPETLFLRPTSYWTWLYTYVYVCRWLVPVASRLYCGHHRVPGKIPSFTRLFFLESMDLAAFCRRNWRYGVWRGWIMRFVKGDAFFLDILWQFRRWKGIWSIFISIYFLEGNVENNSVRWRGCFIIAGDFLFFLDNFWELKSVESNYDGYYDWNWTWIVFIAIVNWINTVL